MGAGAGHQGAVVQLRGGQQLLVQGAIEAHVAGIETEVHRAEAIFAAQQQLWKAVVGAIQVTRRNERIDNVDALNAGAAIPVGGAIIDLAAALQMSAAGGVEAAAAKVMKIVDVADVFVVDLRSPVVTESALVFKADKPAIFFGRRVRARDVCGGEIIALVARQPCHVERVHGPVGEIAHLGA